MSLRRIALAALLALGTGSLAQPAGAQTAPDWIPAKNAEVQALDKITARITVLKAKVGETVTFGTLAITVRSCMARPPDEVPDAAAYLEIGDARGTVGGGGAAFKGWMFAEAPAVNMLEHPVYDIRILSCK